jgi:hypothetical protein
MYTTLGPTGVADLSISMISSPTSYLHAQNVKWGASPAVAPIASGRHRQWKDQVSCDAGASRSDIVFNVFITKLSLLAPRLTRWANSTTTLACSRGVVQLIGPHFMYWILSMFKVQLASRYMYNVSDSQATGQMERPISLYVMQHVV